MSVDTRSKRASAISALRPFALTLPDPSSGISQGDRYHICWAYTGIGVDVIGLYADVDLSDAVLTTLALSDVVGTSLELSDVSRT